MSRAGQRLLPKVAVCFGSAGPHPLTIRESLVGRYQIVWLVDSAVDDPGLLVRFMERIGPVVDVGVLGLERAVEALGVEGVDGITTYSDSRVMLAAQIGAELGLRYHSVEAAWALTDKGRQRSVLADHQVPVPGYWLIGAGSDAVEVAEIVAAVQYPAVLKPRVAHGSRDAVLVDGGESLRSALGSLLEAHREFDAIVEGFLPDKDIVDPDFADVFSLEVVVAERSIHHLTSTGRFKFAEPFRETGGFTPSLLEGDDRDAARVIADSAIRALGVTDGVLHMELKLTPDGPRIVEVNGRSGGMVPKQIKDVAGFDLLRCACDVATGCFAPDALPQSTVGVSFQYRVHPPTGVNRVDAIDGLDTVRALDGVDDVYLKHGPGAVTDSRDGTGSLVYLVTGAVGDHEQLRSLVHQIERIGTVEYTPIV